MSSHVGQTRRCPGCAEYLDNTWTGTRRAERKDAQTARVHRDGHKLSLSNGVPVKLPADLLLGYGRTNGRAARHMPEYRELDIYDRSKHLTFVDEAASGPTRTEQAVAERVSALRIAHHALSDALAARDPLLWEGDGSSWQRYLQLPRTTLTDKMVAEVFRMLRIVHIAATHAQGHVEIESGLVAMSCTFNRCALALSLTEVGAELVAAFVAYYLDASVQPYSATYREWMLSQYFTDIVAEVKKFADEDRILFQFQHRGFFNRHFRYDCDSPRVSLDNEYCQFQLNKLHMDALMYPLDFFLLLDKQLHIVPIEALRDSRIALAKMPLWRASCPDGASLPPSFRGRFVRERMIQGLPMT